MLKRISSSIAILLFLSLTTACGWIADTIEEAGADAVGDQIPEIDIESGLTTPGNQFNIPLDSGGNVTATVSDADEDGVGEGLDMTGTGTPNILYGTLDLKPGLTRGGEKFVTVKLVSDEGALADAVDNGLTDFFNQGPGLSNVFYILVTLDTDETSLEEAVNLEFYDNPGFNGEPYVFITAPDPDIPGNILIQGIGRGDQPEFSFIGLSVPAE